MKHPIVIVWLDLRDTKVILRLQAGDCNTIILKQISCSCLLNNFPFASWKFSLGSKTMRSIVSLEKKCKWYYNDVNNISSWKIYLHNYPKPNTRKILRIVAIHITANPIN